jgi:hypothetical protein
LNATEERSTQLQLRDDTPAKKKSIHCNAPSSGVHDTPKQPGGKARHYKKNGKLQ